VALFTTALGLYGGVLWSGELQGFIIHEAVPSTRSQELTPQFPGLLVGPLPVRKCHQMPSKEHIQLGWVVRWVLSAPPGPPRGWAVRPCRASTSLSPLYSPCASSAFDWGVKAPLPLRASSRGVLPGAGALAGCRTRLRAGLLIKAAASNSRPIGAIHLVVVAVRRVAKAPPVTHVVHPPPPPPHHHHHHPLPVLGAT
jgi:hypothetical protein